MTQAELIQALKDRGYPEATRRGLTSWRAKGLLPRLARHGKGQGRGTRQVWEEPNIIDQAVAVCEFMRQNRVTQMALLKLWLAGFDIEPELAREVWLQRLGRDAVWIRRKSEKTLDTETMFGNLAAAIGRNLNLPIKIDRHTVIDASLELVQAYWNHTYRFEVESAFEPVATLATAMLRGKDPARDMSDMMSEANVQAFFACLEKVFSHESKSRLIEAVSKTELMQAHSLWVRIIRVVSSLFRMTRAASRDRMALKDYGFAIAFGGIAIHALLLAGRLGLHDNISNSIYIVETVVDRIIASDFKFRKDTNPMDCFSETELESIKEQWTSIWAKTDFAQIWNRLVHYDPLIRRK